MLALEPQGCLFVVDNSRMKRAFYFLLMVWIALQSTLVQAHMVEESLHELGHFAMAMDGSSADAEHDDSCAMALCSHPVGGLYGSTKLALGSLSFFPPSTAVPLESAHAVDDIERPKWPTTAPGVAGI